MIEIATNERPPEIRRAVIVAYVVIGLSLAHLAFEDLTGDGITVGFFVNLLVFVPLELFVLQRILAGANWARLLYVAFMVVTLLGTILFAPTLWAEEPSLLVIDIPTVALSALIVWWLVSKPTREWFRRLREESRGAQLEENA